MCFGGSQPQAPQVVYQGPSQSDIDANRAALEQYQSQMQTQQDQFQTQLQAQIDAANQETEALRSQYAADLAQTQEAAAGQISAATAASQMQQVGAYSVGATQSDPLENQKTTAAVTKKEKPKNTLKITQSGLAATAGTGLNIGV